jgi:hypothetical protein
MYLLLMFIFLFLGLMYLYMATKEEHEDLQEVRILATCYSIGFLGIATTIFFFSF